MPHGASTRCSTASPSAPTAGTPISCTAFTWSRERPDDVIAVAEYGGRVTAIVARGNVAGTQFHPEKSQRLGLALIGNFLRWNPE
jgi:imidazoleglycerol phosphate synthase glutamine amidotransferase subunit HisH